MSIGRCCKASALLVLCGPPDVNWSHTLLLFFVAVTPLDRSLCAQQLGQNGGTNQHSLGLHVCWKLLLPRQASTSALSAIQQPCIVSLRNACPQP